MACAFHFRSIILFRSTFPLLCGLAVLSTRCAVDEPTPPRQIDDDTTRLVSVADVTPYSAVISGIFGENVDSATATGIRFSLQNTKYISTTGQVAMADYAGDGKSRLLLDGLYADTSYYFCTFVERGGERINSDVYTFRTHRLTATTDSAIDIHAFGAQLGLTLSEEIEPNRFRGTFGIYYSQRRNVPREQSTLCDASYRVSGLRPGQTYFYRAFVMMKTENLREVYLWGAVRSFQTPEIGVSTDSAADVTTFSATLAGYANVMFDDMEDYGILLFERNRNVTLDSLGRLSDQSIVRLSPSFHDGKGFGRFGVKTKSLKANKRYYYRAFSTIRQREGLQIVSRTYYGDVVEFRTLPISLTEVEVADLGLSVLWAARNYGAQSAVEVGTLLSSAEAAVTQFADGWRLPTVAEAQELIDSCNWSWGAVRRVDGVSVVSEGGAAIFLPANMSIGKDPTYGVYLVASSPVGGDHVASLRFVMDAYNAEQCGKTLDNEISVDAKVGVRLVRERP